MGDVTAMSQPFTVAGSRRAARAVAQALALVGLAMAVGCADGEPGACAELRAALDDLEGRFNSPDDEQSWDAVEETAEATAERDRLTAELARAGCSTDE
jgi:hypothetical protein